MSLTSTRDSKLEFIHCRDPSDRRSNAVAVRSHVSRRQHHKKLEEKQKKKYKVRNTRRSNLPSEAAATATSRTQSPEQDVYQDVCLQRESDSSTPTAVFSISALSTGSSRSPGIPSQVPNAAMLPCESVFDALVTHLHNQCIPSHVSACHLEQSQSRVASAWVQAAYSSEPAFYNALLLNTVPRFACGHLSVTHLTCYLRSAIFQTLADALTSGRRRSEPALLLAVNTLAFHECVFGDLESSRMIHRPALRKLFRSHHKEMEYMSIPDVIKRIYWLSESAMNERMGISQDDGDDDEREDYPLRGGWRLWMPDVGEMTLEKRIPWS